MATKSKTNKTTQNNDNVIDNMDIDDDNDFGPDFEMISEDLIRIFNNSQQQKNKNKCVKDFMNIFKKMVNIIYCYNLLNNA